MSTEASALASVFIRQLEAQKNKHVVSLREHEFKLLRRLIAISPERVVRDSQGNPTVFQFRREIAIKTLKETYQFKTIPEATALIKEARKECH